MSLSKEDEFRLNILVNQQLLAVRIDESAMRVHGLSEQGEATIELQANCRDDQYIKQVKELLSSHVLGSPGGYPVYLKRWTRMGQMRDQSLAPLLLLGEPEAITAVVHASGLTNELARRAWWAMPNADNARSMLEKKDVAEGSMGKELAQFLFEYLPFETESINMINSVRLILQKDLLSDKQRTDLWTKAKRKATYFVGFLYSCPKDLPGDNAAHQYRLSAEDKLPPALFECAQFILSEAGQNFVHTIKRVLAKPSDQDVVSQLFCAIEYFFQSYSLMVEKGEDIQQILEIADAHPNVSQAAEPLKSVIRAILFLYQIDEKLLNPIFARTDAIGTVMQKKLLPTTEPMFTQLDNLL